MLNSRQPARLAKAIAPRRSRLAIAYRMIRRGNTVAHRQWMIRNFASTLAAVALRNYMRLLLFALHWSFRRSYITVSWLCWVPNLLVAEWLVRCLQGHQHSVS